MKRLFLIDGMAVLFRGYFALLNAGLRSREGEPTGATFAFISSLERLLSEENPDLIAVAWDTAEPTFRHKKFEAYKANRAEFPEELIPQVDRVKQLVGLYHIPCLELPGYEADDVIGTIAARGEEAGYKVFCVTPDKDYLQLVTEHVSIYKPSKPGKEPDIIGIDGVREKFGVTPAQVIDVLALMGDSSDNVPGVKGVGEKTAIPLVQEFETVEQLYDRIEEVPKKGVKTKLINDKENAILSKWLVTIDTQVPIDVNLEDLHLDPPEKAKLVEMFDLLGFKSLVKRYQEALAADGDEASSDTSEAAEPSEAKQTETNGETGADSNGTASDEIEESGPAEFTYTELRTIETADHAYRMVESLEELRELTEKLAASGKPLSFDLETDSTDEHHARILGVALSDTEGTGYYVPIASMAAPIGNGEETTLFDTEEEVPVATDGLPESEAIALIKPLLEHPDVMKIGQNAKFDMLILRRYDVNVFPLEFDTMLAAYVLDSTQTLNMDGLAERYIGYRPVSITELIGPKGKNQKSMRDVPVAEVAEYAAEDADVTLQLRNVLAEELKKAELDDVARTFEFPLVSVLTEMEYTGIRVDPKTLKEISEQLGDTLVRLEQEIHDLAGHPFTINSPKQLSEVLFDELGLPPKKKTKTGYSTDQFVMEDLAPLHPLPEKVLEYRQAAKLKSTYVDALPAMINPRTGRVHTSYSQAVTSTGRLSSNNPNLQNIPIRSEIGREIRKAFIAGFDDGVIVAADYSQIELRIMAHICGDEALINAFAEGLDVHTATAMKVFGVDAEGVEPNMRRKAKEVNFGIMYGIGPFGLARRLKISQSEGKELIDTYFREYPGVRDYINGIHQQLRDTGSVETLCGRRRHYGNPDKLPNPQRGATERAAINMPIQGTAADIIKLAMIDLHANMSKEFPKANMLLQVHDELVFETPRDRSEELAAYVKEKMEHAFSLGEVKLVAETGIGESWYEAH